MATDVYKLLIGTGDISEEMAQLVAEYVIPLSEDSVEVSLRELISKQEPGRPAVVSSRNLRNLRFKWKDLLFKVATPLAAGSLTMATGNWIGVFACLTGLYNLVDVSEIVLGEDHAKVVCALWCGENTTSNPVSRAALDQMLGNSVESNRVDAIIDDLVLLGLIERTGDSFTKRDELFIM